MDTPVGRGSDEMIGALVALDQALQSGPLPLELPGSEAHRRARGEMLDQIRDYLLPRLHAIDAPLLVVVGGSTGVGKSTLVSSLVGERVTESGVLRPTTRSPVLVHNPDDGRWFATERIFPRLMRTLQPTADADAIQLAATPSVPAGLAIIDAPDFDSIEQANRMLATELLAAADLWLFVTSAARYADQVPWDHLRTAVDRGTVVAVVLDRVPVRGASTVQKHLRSLMQTRGLADSPLFVVNEVELTDRGMLPESSLAEIQRWLETVVEDPAARRTILDQTLGGAVRALARRSYGLADPLEEQARVLDELRDDVEAAYAKAIADVEAGARDGSLLKGETLLSWQEFVGTDQFLRGLDSRTGVLRAKLVEIAKGRAFKADEVSNAIALGLQTLVVETAEGATEQVASAWESSDAGRSLLAEDDSLRRASAWLRGAADETVRGWQDEIVDALEDENGDHEDAARPVERGGDAISVALMVTALGDGGPADIGEKLLDAVFGEHDTHAMVESARTHIGERITRLLADDRGRFDEALAALGIGPNAAQAVRDASAGIDEVRFASQLNLGPWL